MHSRPASTLLALLAAFVVALLAAIAYRGAITSDFPGGDTLALIEVSRIHSFDDVMTVTVFAWEDRALDSFRANLEAVRRYLAAATA